MKSEMKITLSKSNPLSEEVIFKTSESKFRITDFTSGNASELACFSIIKFIGVNSMTVPFKFADIDVEKSIDADTYQFKLNCDKDISFDLIIT